MRSDLTNKVAIVTGAGRGIGRGVAGALGGVGVRVCVADIEAASARAVSEALRAEGQAALGLAVDVSDRASVEQMVEGVLRRWGQVDILVNNAAISDTTPALEVTDETWDRLIAVNLTGQFLCSQVVGRHMVSRGYGRIVNVSSINGLRGKFGQANYSASKGGEIAMSKALAKELGKFNINVNVVAPGMVMTEMARNIPPEFLNLAIDETVLGRIATPEDCAEVVTFLCSDRARHITGEVIKIDGGQYI